MKPYSTNGQTVKTTTRVEVEPELMSRKRDKPYDSRHYHTSMGKRRKTHPPHPPEEEDPVDKPIPKPAPPPALIIMGLPHNCSVLDLKSRFEIYGSISRIRIDRDGIGCITYRTKDSGDAAIVASHDPSFGITIDSQKVQLSSPFVSLLDPWKNYRFGLFVEYTLFKIETWGLIGMDIELGRVVYFF